MIYFNEAAIRQISIHKTGNPVLDEALLLSNQPLTITDDVLKQLLLQYFLQPFEKVNEVYHLHHAAGSVDMNEVYRFTTQVFDDEKDFHSSSKQLAQQLYNVSNHPNIKGGELYVVHFDKVQIEGELHEAVGLFKSENKEAYITVQQQPEGFMLQYEEQAINIKKLDKGCIIFNTKKEEGYMVAVIDHTNRSEAQYWMDDFLQLKIRNNNYNQTNTVLSLYKTFVTEKMDEVFGLERTDKIDLLNRSIQYFKSNDHFNLDDFGNEVIGNEQGIALFNEYKKQQEVLYDTPFPNEFTIHDMAVKKQARVFKSVLKLDKNFHIYIHGNRELIEKGFDEERNMSYYKVYFREEK
ncbi:MAG: nucleoid-associated protein [Bacteroidetes bacterium]|nr:nucleoid-associated protein [Bacteroidota bacterium]